MQKVTNLLSFSHPVWKSASKVGSLAHTMVAVFLQLKQTLSNHKHYLFTPKDLTSWCIEMMRYLFAASSQDHKSVLEVFTYQARRLFKDKLVNVEDKDKFDSVIKNVLQVWPLLMQFVFLSCFQVIVSWFSNNRGLRIGT